MAFSADDKRAFEKLIVLAIDGELTEVELNQLQDLLLKYPEEMDTFAEHMILDSLLTEDISRESLTDLVDMLSKSSNAESQTQNTDKKKTSIRLQQWHLLSTAAVILLLLSLGVLWHMHGRNNQDQSIGNTTEESPFISHFQEPVSVAVLVQSADAEWTNPQQGRLLEPGVLSLEKGLAEIHFYSGAKLFAEGPLKLDLLSVNEVLLHHGKVRVYVPRQAEGFTIHSAHAKLVDRGTEFGVSIDENGNSHVHVFEGKVDFFKPSNTSQAADQSILTGQSVELATGSPMSAMDMDTTDFPSRQSIEDHVSNRFQQWQQRRDSLQTQSNLLLYYDFDQLQQFPTTVNNLASQTDLTATIVGCDKTFGRWPQKNALEFKHTSDRLRILIPGEFNSLTYFAWVRVDKLNIAFSALLLTDTYEYGNPHWQISGKGELELGVGHLSVNHQRANKSFSPIVFDKSNFGRWVQIATTYDSKTGHVSHYANGKKNSEKIIPNPIPFVIGKAEIGNWIKPRESRDEPIRNLIGALDEFMLFTTALKEHEIQALYELGRPD